MPAFDRNSSPTIVRTARGSSAMSSWHNRKKPLSPSTSRKDLVDGGAEADVGAELAHERRRQDRADAVGDRVGVVRRGGREQEEEPEVPIVLGCEGLERLLEPVAWLVDHHDGHDRRNELGVRFHDVPRLAVVTRRPVVTGRSPGAACRRPV